MLHRFKIAARHLPLFSNLPVLPLLASFLQYYLAKEEGADVEEMLAALAAKLPASLDGGI